MKICNKLILISISLIWFSSVGQNYIPFPEENTSWTVSEFDYQSEEYDTYIYTFNGDTTLNDKLYKKVYQLNDANSGMDTIWLLHTLMRQEVENKKVFFIRHYLGETSEKLGYDFDVMEGDTVSLPAFAYGDCDSLFVIFNADDTIQLWNGDYRRRIGFSSLDCDYDLSGIEGVGGYLTAFPNLYWWDSFHMSLVTCMLKDGEYHFGPSPYPDECDFTVDINASGKPQNLSIIPNPVRDYILIEKPSFEQAKYTLSLINSIGVYVLEKDIEFSGGQVKVDLSSVPRGIYVLIFESDNNQTYTTRLIKL